MSAVLQFIQKLLALLLQTFEGEHPELVSPTIPLREQVAKLVYDKNQTLPYINGVVENPLKGTAIHSITQAQAQVIADAIIAAVAKYPVLTVPFLMACLCIESLFDPNCENGNFAGSNPTKSPDGYDVGDAQLKLKYLIGQQGITTVDEARAFALDPNKSIEYMASEMSAYVATAKNTTGLQGDYTNPYYEATCRYNFGATGLQHLLEANHFAPLTHGEHVVHFEQSFATSLNIPTVFKGIS